eukprot:augustus_masked-scaffold_11-processed-gene-12.78-mRNA-1 protein AED:1.00 eAED:1.00 QI:0/0/0/0/1/1/2/0/502
MQYEKYVESLNLAKPIFEVEMEIVPKEEIELEFQDSGFFEGLTGSLRSMEIAKTEVEEEPEEWEVEKPVKTGLFSMGKRSSIWAIFYSDCEKIYVKENEFEEVVKQRKNGILQKFVEPKRDKKDRIYAHWTPAMTRLRREQRLGSIMELKGNLKRYYSDSGSAKEVSVSGTVLHHRANSILRLIATALEAEVFQSSQIEAIFVVLEEDERNNLILVEIEKIKSQHKLIEFKFSVVPLFPTRARCEFCGNMEEKEQFEKVKQKNLNLYFYKVILPMCKKVQSQTKVSDESIGILDLSKCFPNLNKAVETRGMYNYTQGLRDGSLNLRVIKPVVTDIVCSSCFVEISKVRINEIRGGQNKDVSEEYKKTLKQVSLIRERERENRIDVSNTTLTPKTVHVHAVRKKTLSKLDELAENRPPLTDFKITQNVKPGVDDEVIDPLLQEKLSEREQKFWFSLFKKGKARSLLAKALSNEELEISYSSPYLESKSASKLTKNSSASGGLI